MSLAVQELIRWMSDTKQRTCGTTALERDGRTTDEQAAQGAADERNDRGAAEKDVESE